MAVQVLILIVAFLGAIVLDLAVLPALVGYPSLRLIFEHLSIALIVAAALGLTYEFARERHLRQVARESIGDLREEVHKALEALGRLSPRQVFDLLMDVASGPHLIPTLYKPPRSEAEYNFVEDRKYFDDLVPTAREHVIEALQPWLQPGSSRNVKFLGSDFVGRYELHELKDYLLQQATPRLEKWASISADDKAWILNYVWAASRCEKPRYTTLKKLLLSTPHQDIQEWILFAPRQMDQPDFLEIVAGYLDRYPPPSTRCLKSAIRALAAMQAAGVETTPVLLAKPALFASEDTKAEIQAAWQHELLDPGLILFALQSTSESTGG